MYLDLPDIDLPFIDEETYKGDLHKDRENARVALEAHLNDWLDGIKGQTRKISIFSKSEIPDPDSKDITCFPTDWVADQVASFYKDRPEYIVHRRYLDWVCEGKDAVGCYCCGDCLGARFSVKRFVVNITDFDDYRKLAFYESPKKLDSPKKYETLVDSDIALIRERVEARNLIWTIYVQQSC